MQNKVLCCLYCNLPTQTNNVTLCDVDATPNDFVTFINYSVYSHTCFKCFRSFKDDLCLLTETLIPLCTQQEYEYRHVNVTFAPYIYTGATWVLPRAQVEFRRALDERGLGMRSDACTSTYHISKTYNTLWGTIVTRLAHLLIADGQWSALIKHQSMDQYRKKWV